MVGLNEADTCRRYQVPGFQEAADDGGLVDDAEAAQGMAALGALQGVDCVDLVDGPGPVGAGGAVGRGLIPGQGGGGVCAPGVRMTLTSCPVAIPT